ncbi:M15 family metallopeptidase [Phenylobacterium immobile]|uniref:M15 family metallopeptidase n=1 Tax=Phenylobacterium immobile TaxID=21 RepID=UPI000A83F4C6|nr:M15 family metallopeptidase [Phenylobacterium immobile]
MTYVLGAASRSRLAGVHPDLVRVVERAITLTSVDFKVIEGVRSDEQAYINWGKGRTQGELVAIGVAGKYAQPAAAKVTWLRNPLSTKHRVQGDGYGHAVDLLPAPYDWKALPPFDAVAKAMLAAAVVEKVGIRWGADWDGDGKPREKGETDSPHFELAPGWAKL